MSSASRLVAVGERRASIGEPMKLTLAGRCGSPSSAISAAAASTGGPGWQTATTCARSPMWRSIVAHLVDVVVEVEAALDASARRGRWTSR